VAEKNPSEASAFSGRAYRLAPWNLEYLTTHAGALLTVNRCDEARRLLIDATHQVESSLTPDAHKVLERLGEETARRCSAPAGPL
jgi:hypothetical protein